MRAFVVIRDQPYYRRDAFVDGLKALGYEIHGQPRAETPRPDDVLVIWNRYGYGEQMAKRFEKAGAAVVVAENGYLGRDWLGKHWYALARSYHNGGGYWPIGDAKRWQSWDVPLQDWRRDGREIVVLGTRGIGPDGIREPANWSQRQVEELRRRTSRPVRLRPHPGEGPCVPLHDDLRDAWAVVTWASGAALKAILLGVPVFYGFGNWIGREAAAPLSTNIENPYQHGRLPMLQKLAWAFWNTDEIASGMPFRRLLA